MPVRTITVGMARPGVADVLDYASALIETYGWNHFDPAQATGNVASSDMAGYTLHDAIGVACTRLSAVAGGPGRASKDWTVEFDDATRVNLRVKATELVAAHLPADLPGSGTPDQNFNDQAGDVGEVLAVLRAALDDARAEVTG